MIERSAIPRGDEAASPGCGRAPWARWTIALFLVDWLLLVANANSFADDLRENGPLFPAQSSELISVHVTAIALGLVVAIPLLVLVIWLARRTSLTARMLPAAVALGMLAFLLATRANNAIVLATGMLSWGDRMPFDPTQVIVAPIVEESLKAAAVLGFALLVRRRSRFGVREGIVAGILVGLGANAIETGDYVQLAYADGQGAIYGTIIALRFSLFGFGLHSATAALLGGAIGAALTSAGRSRVRLVVAAFAVALSAHAAWNLVASTLVSEVIVRIAPPPDYSTNEPTSQPFIWIGATAVALVLVAPILTVLVVAWRRASRSAHGVEGDEPGPATASVTIEPAPMTVQ